MAPRIRLRGVAGEALDRRGRVEAVDRPDETEDAETDEALPAVPVGADRSGELADDDEDEGLVGEEEVVAAELVTARPEAIPKTGVGGRGVEKAPGDGLGRLVDEVGGHCPTVSFGTAAVRRRRAGTERDI